MDLQKLFDMQHQLDERILKEKGLEDMDRLPYLMLAFKVELGELANEHRGFKFWSNDREPRRERMLEEYVDCLHFLLSIGLLLDIPGEFETKVSSYREYDDITSQFNHVFELAGEAFEPFGWFDLTEQFIGLGELLGFTWEEIEQAYIEKNKINHERQDNGY